MKEIITVNKERQPDEADATVMYDCSPKKVAVALAVLKAEGLNETGEAIIRQGIHDGLTLKEIIAELATKAGFYGKKTLRDELKKLIVPLPPAQT